MLLKLPVNDRKIIWTEHSKMKLKQYRFSEKRVLRIFRQPDRIEEGIAQGTIAAMQITGTKRRPTEAWMMYVIMKRPRAKKVNFLLPPSVARREMNEVQRPPSLQLGRGVKIISAWRYPGRTPKGEKPIIPEDTLKELGLV